MNRALLCIGAGPLQSAGLRWAREAGLLVVATDRDPRAPARGLAERFEPIDATDGDALVALARELDQRHGLAGAWGSGDFALESVARIAQATGTPGNRPDVVRLALDKDAATRLWRERGVATSRGRLVRNRTELELAGKSLGWPVVVKPIGASGSVGVRVARNRKEAARAFEIALGATEDATGGGVLVETQLRGRHLDVNAFFRDGAFRPAGILDRHFSAEPHCVPVWGAQPSTASPEEERAVYELVEAGARALGILDGPLKADVVLTADGPALLEMAPRFHGDVSSAWVSRLAYGKSPIQAWFATLAGAGGPFDEMPPRAERVAGWMALLPEQPGVLQGFEGVERARRAPGIAEVLLLRGPGHTIETLGDNRAVCGFLWAEGRDHRELEERLRRARALVQVRMEASCPSVA